MISCKNLVNSCHSITLLANISTPLKKLPAEASSEQKSKTVSSSEDTGDTETSENRPITCIQSIDFYENLRREDENSPTIPTYVYFNNKK